MGKLHIMNSTGDRTVEWDSTDTEQVAVAKAEFNQCLADGLFAFAKRENENVMVTEFVDTEEQIVIIPRISGG